MSSSFTTHAAFDATLLNGISSCAPLDMDMSRPLYPPTMEHMQTSCGSAMSFDNGDIAGLDMTDPTLDGLNLDMSHTSFAQMNGDMNAMSMRSDQCLVDDDFTTAQSASLDDLENFLSVTAQANEAPWNPTNPRSQAMSHPGSVPIPGQSKDAFNQAIFSSSLGGCSWDSAYVSAPPGDTASLVSAEPSTFVFSMDGVSEIMEPPAKRSKKTFFCDKPGPHRTRDFANIHDLERHQRSKHGMRPKHSHSHHYRCIVLDCRNKDKIWDRKDNFRSHLVRKHFNGDNGERNKSRIDRLVQQSECELSERETAYHHAKKEIAKRTSREVALRRQAKKSKLDTSDRTAAVAARLLGTDAGTASVGSSAMDDPDYIFAPGSFEDSDPRSALTSPDQTMPSAGLLSFSGPTSTPALQLNGGAIDFPEYDVW